MVQAIRRGPGSTWIERSARVGLAARGLVYGVIGMIGLQIAWRNDTGDEEASKDGALEAIAEQPFGRALLVALAVGFVGFIAWRGSEAMWGRDDEADDDAPKATAKRAASAGKAVLYVTLLASTVRIIVAGPSNGSGGDEPKAFTTRALDLPAGQWLVGSAGVVLLGVAAYLVYRGAAQRFEDRLDTSDMGSVVGRTVDVVGTLGMGARGLLVGVIGFLVLKAALDVDADRATGLDGTLRLIARQPYGRAMLTATATGILAFAVYSFFEARYRDL